MCLLLIALDAHLDYSLIIVANRDAAIRGAKDSYPRRTSSSVT
jgi:uncharacterized protein with NRDE domain